MAPGTSRHVRAPSSIELPPRGSNTFSGPPPRIRTPLRAPNEFSFLDNSLGVINPREQSDSDSSDTSLHPNPPKPNRPAHTRSMSHPFPSLFPLKKKRNGSVAAAPGSNLDSTDEETRAAKGGDKMSRRGAQTQALADKDFTKGNCMTCGSLVRWPKSLKVYRCTVCVTINDLVPVESQAKPPGLRTPSSLPMAPKPKPISLEYTRRLINQCLVLFLTRALSSHFPEMKGPSTPLPSFTPNVPEELSTPLFGSPEQFSEGRVGLAPPIYISGFVDGTSEPTLHLNPLRARTTNPGSYFSASFPDSTSPDFQFREKFGNGDSRDVKGAALEAEPRRIFKPLEDYIVTCWSAYECVNSSFVTRRPSGGSRSMSDTSRRQPPDARRDIAATDSLIRDLDAKLLLAGDIAENGAWWSGATDESLCLPRFSTRMDGLPDAVSNNIRSPRIEWGAVNEWYSIITNCGRGWLEIYNDMRANDGFQDPMESELHKIEQQIVEAQEHAQRVLLKATETLLKRPGRPLREAYDVRFLFLALANPLLYPNFNYFQGGLERSTKEPRQRNPSVEEVHSKDCGGAKDHKGSTSTSATCRHSGIIKRIFGLVSNTPDACHRHLVVWFSKLTEKQFIQIKDLVSRFVTYRLARRNEKKREPNFDVISGLVPNISGETSSRTVASLHAALGSSNSAKKPKPPVEPLVPYQDDWQIKAAARVMALLFLANSMGAVERIHPVGFDEAKSTPELGSQGLAPRRGHVLATSDFYNTLLDTADLIADFEAWESRRGNFTFCQYPFFLSIWAKIQILEYDARRQMELKAREAFFDSIMARRNIDQHLVLRVRRECLVEDSLKSVSEVVGSGSEDIKKGLRIEFRGEEGIDAGGLRKEWFLLLVREVFNPDHGMFVYDEDSRFCYFNPNSFETSDQFFLVGVVLGLAIYNSTILDIALPPFAFRKLLASAPPPAMGNSAHPRPIMNYTLEDLVEFRPRLANGLRQLLAFEGDVEATFCQDFVVEVEKYGTTVQVPLCPGGEHKPVTNANRHEFVDLYVRYLLEVAVTRQFEPFKRGFFTVCGGNALSLFRADEIELLVRGSDEPLDIASLRAAAKYENWGNVPRPGETEPVVQWFWDAFDQALPKDQRCLLLFITGSDRIPAMGAASLVIKVACLGPDKERYPIARTCFNALFLPRYESREQLSTMVWRAVHESEGFGLK